MIYQQSVHTPLGSFLQSPIGYELEHLVATTYSLDAETFVSLAIFGFLAAQGDDLDTVQLKEVVWQEEKMCEWAKEHFTVFSHYLPTPTCNDIIWEQCCELSDYCCTKVNFAGKLFHPKLLLACFRSKDNGEWFYRLQVGSQNLGSESAVELSLCLESRSCQGSGNGYQLHQFFRMFCGDNLPDYLDALRNVMFFHSVEAEAFYQIKNIRFEFNDNQGKNLVCRLKEEFNKDKELRVYSPFLTPNEKNQFYLEQNDFTKVCYYTNLTKLLFEKKEKLDNVFYIVNQNNGVLPFLHAKLYCQEVEITDKQVMYHVFLGSANASENGLEKNVELMISFDWEICFNKLVGDLPDRVRDTRVLYALANGATDDNYSFVKLDKNTTQEPNDDESNRMRQHLLYYLAQCSADLLGITEGNEWKIHVNEPCVKHKIKILFVENQPYSSDMVLNKLPTGKVLRTTLEIQYENDKGEKKRIEVTGSIPLIVSSEDENSFGENKSVRTPMFGLLTQFEARDAIPRCRRRGFVQPTDEVFERLEAYMASWQGNADAWERAKQNAQTAYEGLTSSKNCDIWSEIYIADDEKEKLSLLCKILEGGK